MPLERAIYVQMILFVLTIFAGFACVVTHFAANDGREAFSAMGWSDVADGAITKKVDDGVVAAMPRNNALNGFQSGVEYRVLDDAGPQVRAGCSGWLFLGEEVREVKDGEHNVLLRVEIAKKIAATFARQRVALVMIVVPDKARMAAAELCGQHVSPQAQRRLALWNRLAKDVPAVKVDIITGWPGKPGYWRTDTHWDREGARFAAMRTAGAIESILKGRGAERAVVARAAKPEARSGDLMRLSNLQNAPHWLQPPPDMDLPETVTWEHSGGLLDTHVSPEVILSGSSYSQNSGFADALGLALGREVVQLSEQGGGFDGAVFTLLNKHQKALSLAKVVVWEFPERSLTQPLTDDELALVRPLRRPIVAPRSVGIPRGASAP